MTFDSDAPDSRRFAFYGVDDIKTGQLVMEELARVMDGKGQVAILAGNQNAPNLRKRVEGVIQSAKQHADISIVGTFYRAAEPGTDPFVEVGSPVRKGQVLCIIEAMKLMNEIQAEEAGTITQILAKNAEPVEYDQPLFVIEK